MLPSGVIVVVFVVVQVGFNEIYCLHYLLSWFTVCSGLSLGCAFNFFAC